MTPSEATCKSCGDPIVWGLERGGKWKALEPKPGGTLILFRDRYIMEARWESFDALPPSQRAAIPKETVEAWRAALDGPRYRLHDRTCAYAYATRIDPLEAF